MDLLTHVRDIVFGQIEGLGLKRRFILESIRHEWPNIVGDDIAKVTYAYAVGRDVLKVKVVDNCWRQELHLRKGDILRLVEEKFGQGILRDVVFSVGRVAGKSRNRLAVDGGSSELTEEELRWIEEVVGGIDNLRLKEIMKDTLRSYVLSGRGH